MQLVAEGVGFDLSSSPAGQLVVIDGVRRPLGAFHFVTAAFAPNKPISLLSFEAGLALSDNLRYSYPKRNFKMLEIFYTCKKNIEPFR